MSRDTWQPIVLVVLVSSIIIAMIVAGRAAEQHDERVRELYRAQSIDCRIGDGAELQHYINDRGLDASWDVMAQCYLFIKSPLFNKGDAVLELKNPKCNGIIRGPNFDFELGQAAYSVRETCSGVLFGDIVILEQNLVGL